MTRLNMLENGGIVKGMVSLDLSVPYGSASIMIGMTHAWGVQ